VLAQDGVRAVLLGHPVDHHQDQSMAIRELAPRLLDFIEIVPEAQIEPGQEPADARPANGLVEVGHVLRGDDFDAVPGKAGIFKGGHDAVRLGRGNGRGHFVEGVWPATRSGSRRLAVLGLVVHLRLRHAFPQWGSRC
jgi:hypothetical protein